MRNIVNHCCVFGLRSILPRCCWWWWWMACPSWVSERRRRRRRSIVAATANVIVVLSVSFSTGDCCESAAPNPQQRGLAIPSWPSSIGQGISARTCSWLIVGLECFCYLSSRLLTKRSSMVLFSIQCSFLYFLKVQCCPTAIFVPSDIVLFNVQCSEVLLHIRRVHDRVNQLD